MLADSRVYCPFQCVGVRNSHRSENFQLRRHVVSIRTLAVAPSDCTPHKSQKLALYVGYFDWQEHSLDFRCHSAAVMSQSEKNPNQSSEQIGSGNQFVIE